MFINSLYGFIDALTLCPLSWYGLLTERPINQIKTKKSLSPGDNNKPVRETFPGRALNAVDWV
jgi:hypothetical protein